MGAPDEILQAVPHLVEELGKSVEPASEIELALQIRRLINFIEIIGQPITDLDDTVELYKSTLEHLPADLLELAIDRTRAEHKRFLPVPSDITDRVVEQLRTRQARHRTAVLIARRLAE